MKIKGIAIIGLGYWGPNIIRNLLKINQINNIYGYDLKKENLIKAKKDFPNINVNLTLDQILSNHDIEAIIISTPIETHFEIALKALKSNKHILLEKPITTTTKEAKILLSLAKKQKKILMAGHTFVYSEAVKKIKKNIKEKKIGNIYYYDSTRINLGLIRKDSNVIWDLAPHDFSILNYIIPEKPISVFAFGNSYISEKVEVAHILLRYPNKITAHISLSWLSPVKIRNIIIGGSKKMIVYNEIEPSEKIRIYDKSIEILPSQITPFSPAYRSGDIVIPNLKQEESLFNELNHFTNCIIKNMKPITAGEEGLAVVELLECTDKSLKYKKEILLK